MNLTLKDSSASCLEPVVVVRENEVVRAVLAFLESRGLYRSLDALERESGDLLAQGRLPPRAAALRHLVVGGRWAEAAAALRSLLPDPSTALFHLMRQKYLELICVYEELGNDLCDDLGHAVALCFSELSSCCPSQEERDDLRRLARLSQPSRDPRFRNWDPLSGRRRCFEALRPLLPPEEDEYLHEDAPVGSSRLTDLFGKGLLYEKDPDSSVATVRVEPLVRGEVTEEGWTETILMHTEESPERESFWNHRIQDSLIDGAPEILRRAEEVIGRWESRNNRRHPPAEGEKNSQLQKDIKRHSTGDGADHLDLEVITEEKPSTKEEKPSTKVEKQFTKEEKLSITKVEKPSLKEEKPFVMMEKSTKAKKLFSEEDYPLTMAESIFWKEERPYPKLEKPYSREKKPLWRNEKSAPKPEKLSWKEEKSVTKEEKSPAKLEHPFWKNVKSSAKMENLLWKEEKPCTKEEEPCTKVEESYTLEDPSTKIEMSFTKKETEIKRGFYATSHRSSKESQEDGATEKPLSFRVFGDKDKQNVRDLLQAKDRVREKLLQILNNDRNDSRH